MQNSVISQQTEGAARIMSDTRRLYYLDWLRVIATLGVFLFHASNVFNGTNFEVRNAESSDVILIFDTFFYPWGCPSSFCLPGRGAGWRCGGAGPASSPVNAPSGCSSPSSPAPSFSDRSRFYLSWSHRTQTGMFDGSLLEFAAVRLSYPFPKIIGGVGYHLWFLGFLFSTRCWRFHFSSGSRGKRAGDLSHVWPGCASIEARSCSSSCRSPRCDWAFTHFPRTGATGPISSTTVILSWATCCSLMSGSPGPSGAICRFLSGVGIVATLGGDGDRRIAFVRCRRCPTCSGSSCCGD